MRNCSSLDISDRSPLGLLAGLEDDAMDQLGLQGLEEATPPWHCRSRLPVRLIETWQPMAASCSGIRLGRILLSADALLNVKR